MMIVHEVMGRDCGWLTAATAQAYRARLASGMLLPADRADARAKLDVHAVYIPEVAHRHRAEAARLKAILDKPTTTSTSSSRRAPASRTSSRGWRRAGKPVMRDAFGHVKLDKVQPGSGSQSKFAEKLGAERVLVQKSGYMARAAPANVADRALINACATLAVECGIKALGRRIGEDEDREVFTPPTPASAGDRVPAHQGRQGLRRQGGLVPENPQRMLSPGELRCPNNVQHCF